MKLTRLRLQGFKSFVEPTDFVIEPGLTGVVGPNGCGKSNLVEALRWAMGETSHKSLRAADMDAVIFAGSGNRPARNHAEVVMTIDNADRSAPAAVNDRETLEISRRIEREAGSVYRINGRDVRARDVQILFADAATGARSPALVHQGKIGELIQAKPEQRRRVPEDAAGAAGLQRLTNARELLDREEERAKERVAELDRRLTQFSADIAREQQQTADAEIALLRLDNEDTELKEEIKSRVEQRSGVDERVSAAEATLADAERLFTELTTALADLTAQRHQLDASVRTHRDKLARLDQDIANVQAEEHKLAEETGNLGDLAALASAVETAQQTLAQPGVAAQASEAGTVAARARLDAARNPLNEADKRVQRLETEARTISKIVNGETKNLWPPIIDRVTVAKGYEKALGAALGDDLDAPVDPSAPMRWTNAGVTDGDPALPEGVEALAAHVQAPSELARRLAQIGVVARERGAELVSQLKTGQRLVSPEGDVWRWDGFMAAAHAPTGAARRLAERARLVDIENELEQARIDAQIKRQALENAEAELQMAAGTEGAPREAWRAAQRELNAARERHATAEREINRHAA